MCAHFDPCRLYPEILQSLFSVGQLRSGSRIKDNVCGAVCRMIMANQEAVPLQQVSVIGRSGFHSEGSNALVMCVCIII